MGDIIVLAKQITKSNFYLRFSKPWTISPKNMSIEVMNVFIYDLWLEYLFVKLAANSKES